ncbi:MAG: DNA-directed RNA polymerase subunit alpha [Mycoplasmataceae bacterium]|nr:DNA-directed RNA polymerase subunit alpha [Mycoplasmataceae bacterium]MBR2999243.1 DNA-directed RNA polymerase subunit alpha [Mycoplasmataceae bacterium]MBR3259490.1 DNA-directed RNA polymerase subunit alpha [Mycoplasmataceae bacterium]MBR3571536.1 DNA-directed RNA polymerase subunit alpha [Mycoplasmataceae bacterium]
MAKFVKLKYNEIEYKKINEFNNSFIIQPLERGMANTLGNSLRRVLLSSIYGVAPFAIKIANIRHQYSAIPNTDVDVLTLIAKLSKIPFKYNENVFGEDTILKISFKSSKEGVVTYKDLVLPLGLEIVGDLSTPITTLSSKNALEFDLFIRVDYGYSDEEKNNLFIKDNKSNIDSKIDGVLLACDSNFSPIRRVAYYVEELNSSSYYVQEKLELEIETNGTIEAKDALAQAAKVIIAHLNIIANVDLNQEEIDAMFVDDIAKKTEDRFSSMTINELQLTVRSDNALKKAGITTVSQLKELTYSDLQNINSLGEKSVNEIIDKLKSHGIEIERGDE